MTRIFTCTPVAFGGGADFFARDSGLLCRGLQALGVESRAVMPGNRQADDEDDLLRTAYANLESADWWHAQQLDAVVLYAWGSPRFRRVALAIQRAGVFLVLNQDNSGLISPLAGLVDWLREQWCLAGKGRDPRAWAKFLTLTTRGFTAGLALTDPLRAVHLKAGDIIGCVSPLAARRYRRLCRIYGGVSLAEKVDVIPHAVEERFAYDGRIKQHQVMAVGRWDDVVQKRPWLLAKVIDAVIRHDPEVRVVIAGTATGELHAWHRALAAAEQQRICLRGQVGRDELAQLLLDSQLFYSPSAYESFGIAAAEALCAGCSVVAGKLVSMPAFDWFVTDGCGRLAEHDNATGHAQALQQELAAWQQGSRDPAAISAVWTKRLHAKQVAAVVLDRLQRARPHGPPHKA